MTATSRTSEPLVVDTADPGLLADPYPLYARLRALPGPARTREGAWLLSSFAEVKAALADPAGYSCGETNGLTRRALPVLVGTDPPEHTRLRRATSRFFTGADQRRWLPGASELVREIVSEAARAPRLEAVGRLCTAVPVAVLAGLMNVDRSRLAALAQPLPQPHGQDRRRALAEFFGGEVEARLRSPGDDLISSLLGIGSPDGDGDGGADALTAEEAVAHCGLLLAAGIDAPRDLLANMLVFLAGQPDAIDGLDDDAAAAFAEESIRYFSPVQAVYRTAREEHGHVRPGDRVLLLLAAANRDESVWERADTFNRGRYSRPRRSHPHLGLGFGVHRCLGAALARTAAVAAVRALADLDVRFALDAAPVRGRNICFRRVLRLDLVRR